MMMMIFQAEAVAQRAALLEWCRDRQQEEGGWVVASDSRAVLSNVLSSQRRLTPIMAQVVRLPASRTDNNTRGAYSLR